MNTAIVTIVKAPENLSQVFGKDKRKVAVLGIRRGYQGLRGNDDRNFMSLNGHSAAGIPRRSGTTLGSARYPAIREKPKFIKWADRALDLLDSKCVSALMVLGEDGSLRAANKLYKYRHGLDDDQFKKGEKRYPINVVGIPCNVDNDIPGTDYSIGTDTAVNSTMKVMDSLVGTAYSDGRTFLVETMGAGAGYLALLAALTGKAERVFVPEVPAHPKWRASPLKELQKQFVPFGFNYLQGPYFRCNMSVRDAAGWTGSPYQ